MAGAQAAVASVGKVAASARLHMLLRFSVGTTGAFILCEAMGWYPTFLAPLLAGVLIANLPVALSGKAGVVLILVQAAGAYSAYILTSLLHEAPIVLFGAIGLILFICFANLARGRGFLPILLILIAFATIPIVTMLNPQQASPMPLAFVRGMAVAIVATWVVDAVWPLRSTGQAAPASLAFENPLRMALAGIAVVLPLMLVFLMYAITDALPILITTIVLIMNFDAKRGAMQGLAMVVGNLVGGMVALTASAAVQFWPHLVTLALITFLIAIAFARRVERGGTGAAVALVTFNQTLVLFSLAIAPGGAGVGLWATRVVQFAFACTFAIGMMTLFIRAPRTRVS